MPVHILYIFSRPLTMKPSAAAPSVVVVIIIRILQPYKRLKEQRKDKTEDETVLIVWDQSTWMCIKQCQKCWYLTQVLLALK